MGYTYSQVLWLGFLVRWGSRLYSALDSTINYLPCPTGASDQASWPARIKSERIACLAPLITILLSWVYRSRATEQVLHSTAAVPSARGWTIEIPMSSGKVSWLAGLEAVFSSGQGYRLDSLPERRKETKQTPRLARFFLGS